MTTLEIIHFVIEFIILLVLVCSWMDARAYREGVCAELELMKNAAWWRAPARSTYPPNQPKQHVSSKEDTL